MANGLDPRIAGRQSVFGRNLTTLASLLRQRKRVDQERQGRIRAAEINAGAALLKDKDPEVRKLGLDKIAGAEASGITSETLKNAAGERMVRELMGDVFTDPTGAPGERQQALQALVGDRELGEVQPQLRPESEALVTQRETAAEANRALAEQRKAKTAALEQTKKAARAGNKEEAARLLNQLITSSQRAISDFEKNKDPLVEALTGEKAEEPPEITQAKEDLKLYRAIGKEIISGKFGKQVSQIEKKQEDAAIKTIQAAQKKWQAGQLTDEQYKQFIKRQADAGVSRETISKALGL